MTQQLDPLLTVPEVAERIRKTEQGLRWQIHAGHAPKSALVGGRRLFRESDVEAWIAAQFHDDTEISA